MNGEEQVSKLIFERNIPLRLLGNSHVICSSAASAFDHRSGGPYCARLVGRFGRLVRGMDSNGHAKSRRAEETGGRGWGRHAIQ